MRVTVPFLTPRIFSLVGGSGGSEDTTTCYSYTYNVYDVFSFFRGKLQPANVCYMFWTWPRLKDLHVRVVGMCDVCISMIRSVNL